MTSTLFKQQDERTPDMQYHELLQRIMDDGTVVKTQMDEEAKMVFGHQMRFPLSNGFPIITERDISGKFLDQALGELFCFLNGGHTQADLEKFGCRWWKPWVSKEKTAKRGLEEGDLGPGSYGAAWRTFPTSEGKPFDQITHVVEQIKEKPHLRTHLVIPWVPQYIGRGKGKVQKVTVVPCHGFLHVIVANGEMSLHHYQRSADVPVGLVFNMVQYAALLMMLAQVTGNKPKELVYTISDAHVYDRQYDDVATLLSREPRIFPSIEMDPSVKDIFAFRQEHFKIGDEYDPHPPMVIGTPV
jgi:thymidylate synthase